MSLITDRKSIREVLKKIQLEQGLGIETLSSLAEKINLLFEKIPELNDWFSNKYEVFNERGIIANGKVHIPDRVMIEGARALIIDYKREKQDLKHHRQVKNYGQLLHNIGYAEVEMYLIYIDDQTLVKVK